MTKSEILKSIASMSPEMQADTLIGIGRILEPNARKIGATLCEAPQTYDVAMLHQFIHEMYVSHDRSSGDGVDVDFLDDSLSDLVVGYSFDGGIKKVWTTRGSELPEYLYEPINNIMHREFKRVRVA